MPDLSGGQAQLGAPPFDKGYGSMIGTGLTGFIVAAVAAALVPVIAPGAAALLLWAAWPRRPTAT